MKQANNPTGGPWFRVPGWLGGRYRENRPATDGEAWIELLGRWHQGEDVSLCDLCKTLQWGKGRVMRLHADVGAWAAENGGTIPARIGKRTKSDQKRTAQRTGSDQEQPALLAASGPETDRTRDQIGPGTDREPKKDSVQAPVFEPLEEREVEEKKRETPAPPPSPAAEPDWEAIEAAIVKARDAEIDGYFTSPIEPPLPPRPPIPARIQPRTLPPASPSLQESLAKIREAVEANPNPRQEPTPQRQAPAVEEDLGPSPVAGMDLPTLLGSGAASQRLLRALVAGGLTTAEALERVTFDDLKFMPQVGTTGANAIREALGKHGAGLAMDKGRLLLLSRLAVDHPKPWPPEVTRADKVALKAARVRWRALAEADDFKITDIYRAIEAGRRV